MTASIYFFGESSQISHISSSDNYKFGKLLIFLWLTIVSCMLEIEKTIKYEHLFFINLKHCISYLNK